MFSTTTKISGIFPSVANSSAGGIQIQFSSDGTPSSFVTYNTDTYLQSSINK